LSAQSYLIAGGEPRVFLPAAIGLCRFRGFGFFFTLD